MASAVVVADLRKSYGAVAARSFTVRATTRIDRTEFGMTAQPGMTGRHLDMTVEVRCVRT